METNKDHGEFETEVEAEVTEESQATQEGEATASLEAQAEETLPPGEIENLKNELNETKAKVDEYLDGWQRSRADFANYKKRVERDQAQVYQMAVGNVVKRYLDIADDLELALRNRPETGDGADWADGIELIYRKLLSFLEAEGVMPMESEGQFFDPNLHEAISQEESPDHESGQIIEVTKQGYMLGDRVLRPAMVRVAR